MTQKKILILYTSIGLGHKSIAENIGYHLSATGHEVVLQDAHKVEEGSLARSGTRLYNFLINRLPFVWQWLHDTQWFISATLPYRLWVAGRNYHKTLKLLEEIKPDLVICVQATPSAIMAYLRQKNLYQGKFGIAFSDFYLHRYWLYNQADFYLANIEEQKQEMVALGILPEKIFVCGMMLKPQTQVNPGAVKQKLNIGHDEQIVLMGSGSLGTGVDESLISQFLNHKKIKVIVVCGKNRQMQEKLAKTFASGNVTVLGYYFPMDELYAISGVFITKPGGLSASEALRWRLPILVSHYLPGGERHNYEYLLQNGLVMPQTTDLVGPALEELETGRFKKSLNGNNNLRNLFNKEETMVRAVVEELG